MSTAQVFAAGFLVGLVVTFIGTWCITVWLDTRDVRRDRRNRLELPGDRVFPRRRS